jgi:SAM-dependent methyltransferase
MHCLREPTGPYWDRLRSQVSISLIEDDAYGVDARTRGFVPPVDLIRLRLLLEHGGIHLGLDTICQKTFDPLLSSGVVMGLDVTSAPDGQRAEGLTSGTILAPPDAPFLHAWLASYGDAAAANLPLQAGPRALAVFHGDASLQVEIEPPASFSWPPADDHGLDMLFLRDVELPAAYCLNLWHPRSSPLISGITPAYIVARDTTYNRLARRHLEPDLVSCGPKAQSESRLNLGCGADRREGWLNVDRRWEAWPDLRFDIENDAWPIASDAADEVALVNVLQYVGSGLRHVMSELYRVCRADARVHIRVPHHSDLSYLIDPMIVRRFHTEFFYMYDRRLALLHWRDRDMRSQPALEWAIDFVVESIELNGDLVREAIARPDPVIEMNASAQMMARKPYHFQDDAPEIRVVLRVRKDDARPDPISLRFAAIDEEWYLSRNPDVADALARGVLRDATQHYVWYGHGEYRLPRAIAVDETFYLDRYPDVRAAIAAGQFASGQAHFEFVGFREGRVPAPGSDPAGALYGSRHR